MLQSPISWPELTEWSETRNALHLHLQIVGKYRLARTPWLNHSWHATFYPTVRGLSSGLIEDGGLTVEVIFDFTRADVIVEAVGRDTVSVPLEEMSVAEFHARFRQALRAIGVSDDFHGRPNEIPDPVRFEEDHARRPFEIDAVRRFHRALLSINAVFEEFRTGFIGKSSPVHLFWGSFDLAVTRFSGAEAPLHPGGIPALPDTVTQEAYSHEVASAGFWPGGGITEDAAFYAYAYPTPDGFSAVELSVPEAVWHKKAGEFVLPYEAVRTSDDPRATLLAFLTETFDAACDLGDWPRERLTCKMGNAREPRPVASQRD